MTRDNDALLDELILGKLTDEERAQAEQGLAESATSERDLKAAADTWGALALALDPVAPDPAVFARLQRSIAQTSRFERFVAKLSELIEVTQEKARALLDDIDQATSWEPGMSPFVQLYHLEGGTAMTNTIIGFVRLEAGATFPHHTHLGKELVMSVQGRWRDDDGTVYGPGDISIQEEGSSHEFSALPDLDLVYLAVIWGGVQIGDLTLYPGDPRI